MFFLMIVGIALWVAAHFYKRVAPAHRAELGDKGKGIVALAILVSIILMVIGYRGSDSVFVYDLGDGARYINNLLMLPAIALMGLGASKSRLWPEMRHPMLTGFTIWVFAHLLVNGDRNAIVLFGGLGIWAVIQMWMINTAEPGYATKRKPGSQIGDIRLAVITLVLYAIIAGLHIWLGPNPFTGM